MSRKFTKLLEDGQQLSSKYVVTLTDKKASCNKLVFNCMYVQWHGKCIILTLSISLYFHLIGIFQPVFCINLRFCFVQTLTAAHYITNRPLKKRVVIKTISGRTQDTIYKLISTTTSFHILLVLYCIIVYTGFFRRKGKYFGRWQYGQFRVNKFI